jgi:hypothetical protein
VHALALRSVALVVHSNRTRSDMHDVIVASCSIPGLYARLPVLDGEVHVDGGAADNTLLSELLARGATDITVVTPYLDGAVSPTMFERERTPRVPPHVRLRLISPARLIRLRHFDFDPGRLQEALEMPWKIEILEASETPALAAGADGERCVAPLDTRTDADDEGGKPGGAVDGAAFRWPVGRSCGKTSPRFKACSGPARRR